MFKALQIYLLILGNLAQSLLVGVGSGSQTSSLFPNRLHGLRHSPPKLPVWPVAAGVIATAAELIGAKSLGQDIIISLGGRVVPVSLSALDVSPFLLLAHHRHSFIPFDPLRLVTNLFLPEGFPAHPHSGFDTFTYTLEG